jgi:hypothetical protein
MARPTSTLAAPQSQSLTDELWPDRCECDGDRTCFMDVCSSCADLTYARCANRDCDTGWLTEAQEQFSHNGECPDCEAVTLAEYGHPDRWLHWMHDPELDAPARYAG